MPRLSVLFLLAGLAMAPSARGQIVFGDMGFVVQSSLGTAGDACWGFSCTPRPLAASSGDTLGLTVRAPLGGSFLVVAAAGATLCQPIPGIWHELVLAPPLVVVAAGTIDQQNGTRFCYDGFTTRKLPLPPLPIGTEVALQAAATVGTPLQPSVGWALSSAVVARIQ